MRNAIVKGGSSAPRAWVRRFRFALSLIGLGAIAGVLVVARSVASGFGDDAISAAPEGTFLGATSVSDFHGKRPSGGNARVVQQLEDSSSSSVADRAKLVSRAGAALPSAGVSAPPGQEMCFERALQGHNVLREALDEFIGAYPLGGSAGFWERVPILNHMKRSVNSDIWQSIADITFPVASRADWEAIEWTAETMRRNGRDETVVVNLYRDGDFICDIVDPDARRKYLGPRTRVALLGPFGDANNYGPFSSTENLFLRKRKRVGFHSHWGNCKRRHPNKTYAASSEALYASLLDLMQDDRLLLWVTYAQGMRHRKLVSFPPGTTFEFMRGRIAAEKRFEEQGVRVYPKKKYLFGLTWQHPMAHPGSGRYRDPIFHRINTSAVAARGGATSTNIDPWRARTVKDKWGSALNVFWQSRLIPTPRGLGSATKREIESLLTGGVPVIEGYETGMDRSQYGLPALYVKNYTDLIGDDGPDRHDFLQRLYAQAACDPKLRHFERLTVPGLVQWIGALARNRSGELGEFLAWDVPYLS